MGPWQWWFIRLCLLGGLPLVLSHRAVFQAVPRASTVFLRPRRANSFFVEELLQGNLERECYEERCSYEEAREYFENTPKTNAFWTVYIDGDQCESVPCLNGATCTDGEGGYVCHCPELYRGVNCELGKDESLLRPQTAPQTISPDLSQCPTEGPAACEHFCTATFGAYHCSCVSGYRLHSDRRSCTPEVEYPCGRVSLSNDTGVNQSSQSFCPEGRCQWQVLVLNETNEVLCAGVILGARSVLTSARCGHNVGRLHVRADDPRTQVSVSVEAQWIHAGFKNGLPQDDLLLLRLAQPLPLGPSLVRLCLPTKDFSENILMRAGKAGFARVQEVSSPAVQRLTYMPTEECPNRPLSNKMFCMENRDRNRRVKSPGSTRNATQPDARARPVDGGDKRCGLLPGSPVATVEAGTVFLTGLSLSAPLYDCHGLVFTKLSRYLPWIKSQMSKAEKHTVSQRIEYPV